MDNPDRDDESGGSSDSEEYFDDTDSYYTDEEGGTEDYVSDVNLDLSSDDNLGYPCDDSDEDESEEDDNLCLVEITKPHQATKADNPDDSEYDEISSSDWGELKASIMMADGRGIAEWFAKRKVSQEAKTNIAKVFSPLNLAARVNSPAIFNFLLGEGFPLNTIIHPFLDASLNHSFEIMEKLLDIGADVNVKDAAGTTALHLVARQLTCKPKKIKYLISKGANIDQKDLSGMTPLHYALVMGSKGTIVALLRAGASVNVKNQKGRPTLHMAVHRGMKITALLYEAGARPGTARDYSEVRAAVRIPNANIVRFLIKRNAPVSFSLRTISEVVFYGDRETGREIVDLIVGAGYSPTGDDVVLLEVDDSSRNMYAVDKLKHAAHNPRTLQELACLSVRSIIRSTSTGIVDAVQQLQVPETLKDHVLLKHVTEKK